MPDEAGRARSPATEQPADTAERYCALVEAIDAGYCLLRVLYDDSGAPVDWIYLECNSRFEANTGLAEAVGKCISELVPGIEQFWIDRYAEVARSRQALRFEQVSTVMDRRFDVHAYPVGAPDDHLVGVLFNDVTELRRNEANQAFLQEVEGDFDRLDTLEEIMTSVGARLGDYLGINGCIFLDVDEKRDTVTTAYGWGRSGEPNLIRTFRTSEYINEAFVEESRARRPVLVADTETDPRTDARAYAGLNIRSFMTIPHHQDGVWTHYLGVTCSYPRTWRPDELQVVQSFARLVFTRLVRAQAEAAVRESEARFRTMADAVPQIVWITGPDGRMEFFNRHWARYTGDAYHPATAAEAAAAVIHPDDLELTVQRYREARAARQPFTVEHRLRAASGEYRWFLARAEPELDPASGKVLRWFGASVDIHDRRMAEEALAQTDRRKDEFLATLAHELRNPLAPIRTGLSLLELNPPPETVARTREVMKRQLVHMVRLIDDLMDVSRISRNKLELRREPLDLREVVDEAVEANRPAISQAGLRLGVCWPAVPIPMLADRTRLVQVFGNLLSNAVKYTPAGGSIEIRAEVQGGEVVVTVRDSGIGIEREWLDEVFEIFSQVASHPDHRQGGLGIGLALVQRLVALHGGTVRADSDGPGRGSTFTVVLPTRHGDAAAAPTSGAMQGSASGLQVLVVDDNVDAAEMLCALLDTYGHSVRVAHDGTAALAAIDDASPQVVLLDIGLPDMDGYEVARRIRARHQDRAITLIALTGWGSEADRARAFDSGIDHHLTKPVDMQRLGELLRPIG